jgi:outer membrane protein OmpA-like peptidoglycan-associated protein
MKRLSTITGLAVFLSFLHIAPSNALNVQLLRPTTGHAKGYHLFTSDTLPKYQFAAGLNVNYAHRPLEQVVAGTTIRTAGVVDHFVTADFLLSYGITDWLNLSLDMPVNIYHNIAPTLIPARDTGFLDAGDLMATLKIRIFDAEKTSSHLGLAIVPFITAPTGDSTIFFGDKSLTGGGILVGDAQWKSNRFYINIGARARQKETLGNLVVNEELMYGLGFTRPIVKAWDFNIIAEAFGSTNFRKFTTENITSPIEVDLVFQKKWLENRRLITHLGGGAALTNGYGSPDYRITTGVSYAWDLKREGAAPRPPEKIGETIDLKGQINFEYDKAVIKPESYAILDDVVDVLNKHPELTKILIEGHTDSKGSDAYNQKLSERRAASLKTYLVSKGIDPLRLGSIGYGESRPIAPNQIDGRDNPEGRAQNRRSVFRVVERTDK